MLNIVLQVVYPSGAQVSEGNVLTPTQVKDKPTLKWDAAPDQFYTVAMTGEHLTDIILTPGK